MLMARSVATNLTLLKKHNIGAVLNLAPKEVRTGMPTPPCLWTTDVAHSASSKRAWAGSEQLWSRACLDHPSLRLVIARRSLPLLQVATGEELYGEHGIAYRGISAKDEPTTDILADHWAEACNFIEGARHEDKRVRGE